MQSQNNAVELVNIRKDFGSHMVFDSINLTVPTGLITGICGPNGAGKSILLRIICGLVKPTHGEVVVFGQRLGVDCEFAPSTGVLIDQPGLLFDLSARKNLEILAGIQQKIPTSRIAEVLQIVGLDPTDKRPVKEYSNGMRKRLGIAEAILEEPRLLLLDEPTDAIDQAGWRGIYQYLLELKESGTTILFSSNKMDEITILCDRAVVLADGKFHPIDPENGNIPH
jgi:ABC-2 type transport system ATP-binding protein